MTEPTHATLLAAIDHARITAATNGESLSPAALALALVPIVEAAVESGRQAERAAIVSWLHKQSERYTGRSPASACMRQVLVEGASALSHGAHRRTEPDHDPR